MPPKKYRLLEFFRRLGAAPAANTEDSALDALGCILIEVENELTTIPFDPNYPLNDGRMYPPKKDARRSVPGRHELARYRSKDHNIYISVDGAIRIEEVSGQCMLEKPGHDGRLIQL